MFSKKFLQRFLKTAQIVVLTGSGIRSASDDSEIDHSLSQFRHTATAELMTSNPQEFWKQYVQILKYSQQLQPNLGHYALVDLEKRFDDFLLITTEIDGLHEKAGNKKVIELYGQTHRMRCLDCGLIQVVNMEKMDDIPVCQQCGGTIRPYVRLNDEKVDEDLLIKAQSAAAACELFLAVGVNQVDETVRTLPMIAKANGAYLAEVNFQKSFISDAMNEIVLENPIKLLTALVLILEKIS